MIEITHPFPNSLVITQGGNITGRLWLGRDEAMELLEKLPSAIAQMPVGIFQTKDV